MSAASALVLGIAGFGLVPVALLATLGLLSAACLVGALVAVLTMVATCLV